MTERIVLSSRQKILGVGFMILFSLFFALVGCPQGSVSFEGIVSRGIADLRGVDFTSRTVVRLNGIWHFWKDELLDSQAVRARLDGGERVWQSVPGAWSNLGIMDSADSLSRGGTLALELMLPPGERLWSVRLADAASACELEVDGEVVARVGVASLDRSGYLPGKGVETGVFTSRDGRALMVLRVANHDLSVTGTWDPVQIGSVMAVNHLRTSDMIFTAILSGAMIFMGLYHLSLFILRPKDTSTLIFGIICLLMATRNLMMGERILMGLFSPDVFGWALSFLVEHQSVHLCMGLFLLFFRKIFPKDVPLGLLVPVLAMNGLWLLLEIFFPPIIANRWLPVVEYFIMAGSVSAFVVIILAVVRGREGAPVILTGLAVMVLAVVNDVLFSNRIIQTAWLTPVGMFVFTFSQSFFLSRRSANLFTAVERYAEDLRRLNQSLERFIPRPMLDFLGKQSIVDVGLGNFTEARMTVFFLDIRDFTTRSENMTPEANFRFLNHFLERFGPLVRSHGGLIDKYLGDGFMALFPRSPDDAVDAALDMRRELEAFNREASRDEGESLRFGIGIHTGPLMLGTIGEDLRMDTTVISDTVNTASRLEELNKQFNTDILVSAETVAALEHPERYTVTRLAEEKVKGKNRLIRIYAL